MHAPRRRPAAAPPFADLLGAARLGDDRALRILYNRWNQPLTAFAVARGAVDVDEVVSETFLGAFGGLDRFEGTEREFRAWLFRILRNKIADGFRRAGRRVPTTPLEDRAEPAADDVERDALRALTTRRIGELLAELTDEQAEVLLLRIVGDLTIEQIAVLVGRRPGAVKALQRRGLDRLRRCLDPDDRVDPTVLGSTPRTPNRPDGR